MGCGLLTRQAISIQSLQNTNDELTNVNRIKPVAYTHMSYIPKTGLSKISVNSLVNIVDYLSFMEVREVGKINRLFNQISKGDMLLIKFFKKKDGKKIPSKTVITFSALQKHSSESCYSTSSDE